MKLDEKEALDDFGKLIVNDLRDKTIEFFDLLTNGHWKDQELKKLQGEIQSFDQEQIEIIRRALIKSLDVGIHDFLFKIHEQEKLDNKIEIKVQGINIIEVSDGLHGELFTEDGWIESYSRYSEIKEEL